MRRDTINLREDRMVVLTYDESVYRQGERQVSNMIAGTPEQIAEHVKQSVLNSLSYGSHVTAIHFTPITPANVWTLNDEGMPS